ncbi:hypothetical protein B0T21DRAFT_93026 [Apiosordaria backusii]|uniref:Uncharacterized protein n=1 Tax=Apiosordaria backusii TaxID=314023 RepID=A0AA40K3P5_9PEZI|nr:hypothetical protein B0T21DRAFT_93026 [Apiosordaria backusii]
MALPWLSPFYLIALLILLYEIEEQVQFPATVRLLENSICQRHYDPILETPVEESLCKISVIQRQLANIRGWYSALGVTPMLVLGPFYGSLACRVGCRVACAFATTCQPSNQPTAYTAMPSQ